MAQKVTTDDLGKITLIIFHSCSERTPLKCKIGMRPYLRGNFYYMNKNSFQIVLINQSTRLKPDQKLRLIFFEPAIGTIDFTTTVIDSKMVRRPRNKKRLVHELRLPRSMAVNDRRKERRFKLPAGESIVVKFCLGDPDQITDSGKEGEADGSTPVAGPGNRVAKIMTQLVDISTTGLRTLSPETRFNKEKFTGSKQPLYAVFKLGEYDIKVRVSLVGDYKSATSGRRFLLFRFLQPGERLRRKIRNYIQNRTEEIEAKELKRINAILDRRSRIIDPRTLRQEMSEEELERIKWRRMGDIFIVQIDRLSKGEKAFQVFIPKRGQSGTWVRRASIEE